MEESNRMYDPNRLSPEYLHLCELVDADPEMGPMHLHVRVGNIIKQYPEVFSLYGISYYESGGLVYYGDLSVIFA